MTEIEKNIQDGKIQLYPIARAILQGVYDEESPFFLLFGLQHILQRIWKDVISFWRRRIKVSIPVKYQYSMDKEVNFDSLVKVPDVIVGNLSYLEVSYEIQFPTPTDLNINMMPFVMGRTFEESFLPINLKSYYDRLILRCLHSQDIEIGKIGYLTIHESYIYKDSSQRRPGVHTESPGIVYITSFDGKESTADDNKTVEHFFTKGEGNTEVQPVYADWGRAWHSRNVINGGIYMASTVKDSCKVWKCQITQDCGDIIGTLGDLEKYREFLPDISETMKPNQIYWLTDRTPHESLPLKKSTYRQFFRLVTSKVSVWFEDHSTKNPHGIVPDPEITKIVKGSKFENKALVLVENKAFQKMD